MDDLGIIAQQVVGDIPQRGQGMAFVQQYHHAELPEHLTGERVFPQEVVQRGRMLRLPAHDAQIGGAGGDVADNGGSAGLAVLHLQRGAPLRTKVPAERLRNIAGTRRTDGELRSGLGMGAEHRLQAFHLRDDAAGIAQKILAVFGGRHTAGRALEQCDAKLRLQLPDVLAQVGLAHIQIFGCGGYGPRFGDLDGVAQLLQVHDVHLRNRYVKIDIGTIPIIHYPAGKESDKILTRDKGTAAPALLPQQPDPGALPPDNIIH